MSMFVMLGSHARLFVDARFLFFLCVVPVFAVSFSSYLPVSLCRSLFLLLFGCLLVVLALWGMRLPEVTLGFTLTQDGLLVPLPVTAMRA